ncbi:hypothetical protein tb265_44920 [Gemmatimonadetes bacterium T265]|nr:hypothetical protein tb265_44920 [Gemmatimonadetes bacterium T265]
MVTAHRRILLAALLLVLALLAPRPARATWSIVVLDRARRWIGVAGASCTPDVYGILNLRPGEGVLVAQAIGHDAAIQRANQLLAAGVAPDSVLRVVTAPPVDPAPWFRQYAAASFAGDPAHAVAQFTGDSSAAYHGARRTGDGTTDVLVQGNSLPGPAVLDRAVAAIGAARRAGRPLYDVLMAGLAAGAAAGGDVRCGAQRATSAFLVVARPGERPYLPYLTLAVFRAARGTAHAPGVNAVDVLAGRLARWEASGGPRNPITNEGLQPPAEAPARAPAGQASPNARVGAAQRRESHDRARAR